ncbi:MAG: polysaccharide deacetylase family protein [Steroidobacteraceae bacterium]
MKLALKIDVDTYRGTREGVPNLLRLLDKYGITATFLFSLGPDHTGRALKRAFRPGFLSKVSRTSVVSHYGIKTLMYGVLLPGPDIGRRCAGILRSVRDAGHEVGIHTWDHIRWQDGVEHADNRWTEREMQLAVQRFSEIFGCAPQTHGAAGWQMNNHAIALTEQLGFDYSSDSRGHSPFLPWIDGKVIACPQLPSTLPTLDELIGVDDLTEANVARHVLQQTAATPEQPPVYTLHAELEGMKLLPVFEQLLQGWRTQGYALTTSREIFKQLQPQELPVHRLIRGTVPGRSGTLMIQGPPVVNEARTAPATPA